VTVADAHVRVTVRYRLLRTQEPKVAQFTKRVE
jgi:hypothetical protein